MENPCGTTIATAEIQVCGQEVWATPITPSSSIQPLTLAGEGPEQASIHGCLPWLCLLSGSGFPFNESSKVEPFTFPWDCQNQKRKCPIRFPEELESDAIGAAEIRAPNPARVWPWSDSSNAEWVSQEGKLRGTTASGLTTFPLQTLERAQVSSSEFQRGRKHLSTGLDFSL